MNMNDQGRRTDGAGFIRTRWRLQIRPQQINPFLLFLENVCYFILNSWFLYHFKKDYAKFQILCFSFFYVNSSGRASLRSDCQSRNHSSIIISLFPSFNKTKEQETRKSIRSKPLAYMAEICKLKTLILYTFI